MAVTRKGRLKCDACGVKQAKDGDAFLFLGAFMTGPGATFDGDEEFDPYDVDLTSHFCSWVCLGDEVFEQVTEHTDPEHITGD